MCGDVLESQAEQYGRLVGAEVIQSGVAEFRRDPGPAILEFNAPAGDDTSPVLRVRIFIIFNSGVYAVWSEVLLLVC
jgi:hypothetical protein